MKIQPYKILFLGASIVLSSVAPAFAATNASLKPAAVSASAGSTFNLEIWLDPQGATNYTAAIELNYPADKLEARSFRFGSEWMALSQPSYDKVDNVAGSLIKTAGYPGGVSRAVKFGEATFFAKKSGEAAIAVGKASLALNDASQNVISSASSSVLVTIKAAEPVSPTSGGTPKPETEPTVTPEIPEEPEAQLPETEENTLKTTSFLGMVNSILTLGTENSLVGGLMGAAIAVISMVLIRRYQNKKKK